MKLFLSFIVLLTATGFLVPQKQEKQLEFSIIFSGRFEKDTISLNINNRQIVRAYPLDNTDSSKQEHLNLSQYESDLVIHYNSKKITRAKIPLDHSMQLQIQINKEIKKCTIDLRKGRAIVIDYRTTGVDKKLIREIFVEQIAEPTLLF